MTRVTLSAWLLLTSVVPTLAQTPPDFSGIYNLASLKGEHVAKKLPKTVLTVRQTQDSLEVIEAFDDGKTVTSKYSLDGKESKNTTSGGMPTADKVEVKGKNLIIRSTGVMPNGVSILETQKWELSTDSKTLKIRRSNKFGGGMSMLDDSIDEIYRRQ
jgi:hypothetical protein